jgi:rhamnogalacturonyl hydrolase YesR
MAGWLPRMSELLRSLPKDNPDRVRIMEGNKTMMASLLKFQAEDGMWRQLIDDPGSLAGNLLYRDVYLCDVLRV